MASKTQKTGYLSSEHNFIHCGICFFPLRPDGLTRRPDGQHCFFLLPGLGLHGTASAVFLRHSGDTAPCSPYIFGESAPCHPQDALKITAR